MSEESLQRPMLKYRPEIDGLRAVAVLSVMAFHMNWPRTPGGFVGVDIFFVISGYLISSIILREICQSSFSILGFYERRIRRIFPALFAMLIVFTGFALIYILPSEFSVYAKSLLAATCSVSNFYFWQHAGYFDSQLSNPLLHTWSLAVEEQFYIFFPLFLLLVRSLQPKRIKTAVVVLFFASLAVSSWQAFFAARAAFYMPSSRAWELLMGTMLSLGIFPRLPSRLWRNVVAAAGLLLIAYPVCFYSMRTPFPGLYALAPCLGAALIIGASESGSSLVCSGLSLRPVVFVGLISYSLYLWHWPVIVAHQMGLLFSMNDTLPARYITMISPRFYDRVINTAASFLLAILSWRFVERPFRSGSLRLKGPPLFALAGSLMAVIIGFSIWANTAAGFTGRFSPKAAQIASFLDDSTSKQSMRLGSCFIAEGNTFRDYRPDLCLHSIAGKKNYLLLGDSHSAAIWTALSSALPGANVMQASAASCEPVVRPVGSRDCKAMMNYIFQGYLTSHPVDTLFLEQRWDGVDINRMSETVAWAAERKIPLVIFGPVQEYDAPLPRLMAYAVSWNKPEMVAQHRILVDAVTDARLAEMAANTWHVRYVSLYKAICNAGNCTEYADEAHTIPLMFDTDHLSVSGSALVIHGLVQSGELY